MMTVDTITLQNLRNTIKSLPNFLPTAELAISQLLAGPNMNVYGAQTLGLRT